MKQDFKTVAEPTDRCSRLGANQLDMYRTLKYPATDMAYETEESSVKSNTSNHKHFSRHPSRRNKLTLPYRNYGMSTGNALIATSRNSQDKREMKCEIHSEFVSIDSENKLTNNQAHSGNLCNEYDERMIFKQTTPLPPKEFIYQNKEHHKLNKEFSLTAKYINLQENSISHNIFSLKDETLGGKGDYFAETALQELGFFASEIKWDNLKTTDRRELHPILHERLCSVMNPDIVLLIDEHEFFCHRIVLQCYSTFFDELNNLEAKNYLKLEKGVSKEAFFVIYAWMLTIGQGGFYYLRRDNILEVLIACQYLGVTDLEEQCLAFIDNEQAFSEENAFHLFMDASKLKHKSIMELMVPRIKAFFLHLVSSREFVNLRVEDLCIFLQSNYAIIHCEMEMFMSAVRWLMFNWEERKTHLITIMNCIRFGLMSPSQLVDIRKNPESPEFLQVTEDKSVQKLIDDGMAYSVENSLSGEKADHMHRCNLLKLDVPEPRNFPKETKIYSSYKDFLTFLQDLQKNPKYMYKKNCKPKPNNSEESFLQSHDSNMQSQDDSSDSENSDKNQLFMDKKLKIRNKSLPMFGVYSAEQKECEIKKFEECYGQNLFRECVDSFGNKVYRPVDFHTAETYKAYVVNDKVIQSDNQINNTKMFNEVINGNTNDKMNSYKDYNSNNKQISETSDAYYKKEILKAYPKKINHKLSLKESAAIIIQSTYRGFKERKTLFHKHKKNIMEESIKRKMVEFNKTIYGNVKTNYINDSKSRINKSINSNILLKRSHSSDSNLSPVSKAIFNIPGSLYFPHHPSILIFGGKNPGCKLTSLNNSSTVYRYMPGTNAWEIVDYLPKARYHHSTAMLKGKIYVIGGSNPMDVESSESKIYNENWSFDPVTRKWEIEAKLLTPRKSFGLVMFHGYMFAIGGQDRDNKILSSVERYDHSRNKWEEVTPLPEPLIYPAVSVYKNLIWVAGGLNNYPKAAVSAHVYCYDPCKNLWSRSTPLRFGRGFSTLINYEDSLHLIGGAVVKNDELLSTEAIDVWDDRQEKWKLKANMSLPRHGHVVAISGTKMLMIGGSTTKYVKSFNQVDAWCMVTGAWKSHISNLPVPVVGHSLVTLPPSTHV